MNKDTLKNNIIISNGYLPAIAIKQSRELSKKSTNPEALATVLSNILAYGFIPSKEILNDLFTVNKSELSDYWKTIEPSLKEITGDDLNISEHILYKNFPKEVLDTPHALYWLKQFFVYMGMDYDFVREPEKSRETIDIQEINPTVLHKADDNIFETIFNNLIAQKSRWNDNQNFNMNYILSHVFDSKEFIKTQTINLEHFGFKENGLNLINFLYTHQKENPEKFNSQAKNFTLENFLDNLIIKDATDILRLSAALSEQDVALKQNIKFKNFKRFERRALINKLEKTNNLEADMIMRPELFKKLFAKLHPGDYKAINVNLAYDKLYKNSLYNINSEIEEGIKNGYEGILGVIAKHPGQYIRKFHHLYEVFGDLTLNHMEEILPQINLNKLAQFKKYIETINTRESLMFAPKGQWNKVQVSTNNKIKIKDDDKKSLLDLINKTIQEKLSAFYAQGFDVAKNTKNIKLQTNDQKLADYGRGTVFDIPENINFIRTSSFWNIDIGSFLDNTWNFFNENWKTQGVCCWNRERFVNQNEVAAVFSGDAINKEDCKAAQLVDIYLKELENSGIKYAVWSSLSFSNIPFNEFKKAHMGLQMGENAQKGKQFDPSRVTMAFPLEEAVKTKVIAYIDVPNRKLVYTDVNLKLNKQSGENNKKILSELMPKYVEYLNAQPSIYDLLATHPGTIPVVYSDKDIKLKDKQKAYVFKSENQDNSFENIQLSDILKDQPIKSKKHKIR